MEVEEREPPEKESQDLTVDFSKLGIKKIERASGSQQHAVTLILDSNEIQRLDNLDSYAALKKLSLSNNQLVRMYGVCNLKNLEYLDVSCNLLVTIEGLKELKALKYLNISTNKIKTIEHLNSNLNLEKLDLSSNSITHISDLSFLKNLKELNLHCNKITHLRQCEKNLPTSLEILTLRNNSICDLNEISYLSHLISLKILSFAANPCVDFQENHIKFNYRPFIKNWCSSLVVLDDSSLDDIECLKAEWLYSQGRGRSFRPGEHAALAEYLSSVCPKEAEPDAEAEDVKKLKLILSKAQQYQQQLREQISTGTFGYVQTNKTQSSKKKSIQVSERMVTSYQDSPVKDSKYSPELMTRSLDSSVLRNSPKKTNKAVIDITQTPLQTSTTFIPIPDTLISPDVSQTLQSFTPQKTSWSSRTSCSSSKNSCTSTPESKRKSTSRVSRRPSESCSPVLTKKFSKLVDSRSSTPLARSSSSRNTSSPGNKGNTSKKSDKNYRETSDEEGVEGANFPPVAVRQKVTQKKHHKIYHVVLEKENVAEKEKVEERTPTHTKELENSKEWKAAVCIQRRWRGYSTRNLNNEVLNAFKDLRMSRMEEYILKVANEMEATRLALEGNRKLQMLQIQAINALWKKMTTQQTNGALENANDSKTSLENLIETCSNLKNQIDGIYSIVKTMQSAPNLLVPMSTQTEIVAVHTPLDESKHHLFHKLKPENCNFSKESSKDELFNFIQKERHLMGDSIGDCENNTSLNTSKTFESFSSCRAADSEAEENSGSEFRVQPDLANDTLVKPTVKLSETKCDVSNVNSSGNSDQKIDSTKSS